MSVTRATVEEILKEDYTPPVVDQFNTKTLLMRLLNKNTKDFGGLGAYLPLFTHRTHSHGARAENGNLPAAKPNRYSHAKVTAKFNYAKMKISGPSMSVARKDRYAFLRTLEAEIRGVTEGFVNDFNRQEFGSGGGVVTQCGVTSASTTVLLDSTDKDRGWGTLYLEEGMLIDIRTMSTGVAIASGVGREVISVNHGAGTIELDAAGGPVDTTVAEAIYIAGNQSDGSENFEVMGLQGIVADRDPSAIVATAPASLEGVPSSSDFWKASVLEYGGVLRPLTFELLHDLLIAIDKKSGYGDQTSCFITTHEIWKKFGMLMTPDRRYGGDPDIFEGGFKYLTFDGIKMFFEKYCQPNRVYAPNLNYLTLYHESPLRWDETDTLLKWDNSSDAFEAFLVFYSNVGTDRRSVHGVLEDILQ